jgi:phenylalanyl-tRNA synthetase beta chain
MKVSLRWLGELLEADLDPATTREQLALLGAPVDAEERLHAELSEVVVGLVLEAKRHPNADRLTLTRVDAGGPDTYSVVCGAPNVTVGAKYPFAPAGAVLPGGLRLERRKIRGEVSEGMLCSARELGLGQDGEGIMELATDAAPGTPLLEVLPLADTRFELDVGANRPDLLSHEGVARDLGAVLGRAVKLPRFPGAPAVPRPVRAAGNSGAAAGVRVTIEDLAGCGRYAAAVIRGVRIGPSPEWLASRLAAAGSRSISNVVDATNYLMLENGQPLHAFDLAKLAGPAIIVRRARPGETLTTLDGQPRSLREEMCVIADAERAVALAGVMGGAGSEVTSATTDVLLECAWFDPRRTRRMRTALGMSTDASYRFERGLDCEATALRLQRAAELIVAVAGGRIEGMVDVFPAPPQPRTIFLRDERITKVLGAEVPRAEVERVLTAIGCVAGPRADRLAVQVPAWRPDLEREIDLVEEVARLVGYGRFPDTVQPYRPGTVPDSAEERLADRLRSLFTSLGLCEAVTLPLGPRVSDEQPAVLNPLSREEAFLRHDLLGPLARRVEHNWRRMVRDVRLFEIGHVFARSGGRVEEAGGRRYVLPREEARVAGVISGARRPPHWSEPEPPDCDLFDARALLESARSLVAPQAQLVPGDGGWLLMAGAEVLGRAAALAADRPAWAGALFGFEVSLPALAPGQAIRYRALPEWPAVERDVALILPPGLASAAVEETLRGSAGKLLEQFRIFDEYRGRPLAEGERSVAWRLVFRAPDRTLREEEADRALAQALKAVEESHGVRRREA